MTEQIQTKGLSKGCTIALIVGGVIFVLIVALVILVIANKDDLAGWTYNKTATNEKRLIAESNLPGIDSVEVNRVADEFMAKVDTARYASVELLPFLKFMREQATDEEMDSAEAADFVKAMVESFPDLAKYKNNDSTENMTDETDSSAVSNQSY